MRRFSTGDWLHRLIAPAGAAAPLSGRAIAVVRSDTRTLIGLANEAEQADAALTAGGGAAGAAGAGRDLPRLLSAAERQLASSISGAISREVDLRLIEEGVIAPILRGSTILSAGARQAVGRALRSAGPGSVT